jgi:hypothetical protein
MRILRLELEVLGRFHTLVTLTAGDARDLLAYRPALPVEVNGVGVDCRRFPMGREPRELGTLLFVGNYRHQANVDAVEHLLADILPRVRTARPEAQLRIVGSDVPRAIRTRHCPEAGVEVIGWVADLPRLLARAGVFVAPIRLGCGMRVKVLEAMAAGCPVVTTALGAAGLEASSDALIVADDCDRFAAEIVGLLGDPARARALGQRAREEVERHYDWSVVAERHAAAYARLLAPDRRRGQSAAALQAVAPLPPPVADARAPRQCGGPQASLADAARGARPRLLVVGSGTPWDVAGALKCARILFPGAEILCLVYESHARIAQRGADQVIVVEDYLGERLRLFRTLRAARFEASVVTCTRAVGYAKLRLAGLFVGAGSRVIYGGDANGGMVHVRGRWPALVATGREVLQGLPALLARMLRPIGLVVLIVAAVGWEWRRRTIGKRGARV